MRRRPIAAVVGVCAALALACGLTTGTATAGPAPSHRAEAAAAANPCTGGAAASGHGVRHALSRTEVHRQLGGLTRKHRELRGAGGSKLPGKGPLTSGKREGLAGIHPAQGTAFRAVSGADGACATQSVSTAVNVQDGYTTIYTPTLYPPGGTCIELVTVYNQGSASVSAWDWCRSVAFEASVPIDDAFLQTYTDGSAQVYTGRVIRTDAGSNGWTASLYNHKTGSWDTLFSQSGQNQSGRADGWDINELYSQVGSDGVAYSCLAMRGQTFESSNISVRVNGQWSPANPQNSDTHYDSPAGAFQCPDRDFRMVSQYDHWKVVG